LTYVYKRAAFFHKIKPRYPHFPIADGRLSEAKTLQRAWQLADKQEMLRYVSVHQLERYAEPL
jgi:hypothetical protein